MQSILVSLFFPLVAHAIGLTVTPSGWNASAIVGEPIVQTFTVTNAEDIPLRYKIWTNETAGAISFLPTEWRLNPAEQEAVTARLQFDAAGQYEFDISILAQGLNPETVEVGTGVHIPVSLTLTEKAVRNDSIYTFLLISAGILMLVILFIVIRFLRLS